MLDSENCKEKFKCPNDIGIQVFFVGSLVWFFPSKIKSDWFYETSHDNGSEIIFCKKPKYKHETAESEKYFILCGHEFFTIKNCYDCECCIEYTHHRRYQYSPPSSISKWYDTSSHTQNSPYHPGVEVRLRLSSKNCSKIHHIGSESEEDSEYSKKKIVRHVGLVL